jgi:hypothetical protein
VIVDEAADVEEALTEARRHLAERLLASFQYVRGADVVEVEAVVSRTIGSSTAAEAAR